MLKQTRYAVIATIVACVAVGFLSAPLFLYAAEPIPGSKCPDPKGKVIECYDDTTEGADAFKGDIKAVCAGKGVCEGKSAKDASGKEISLKALGDLLGALGNLMNLLKKQPEPPKPPTTYPPFGYGCVNTFDGHRYLQDQAFIGYGCCGPVLSGSVMPICSLADPRSQAAKLVACPSVRMLCCNDQWLFATSSSSVCPPLPAGGTSGIKFSIESDLTETTKGAGNVVREEKISENILKSIFGNKKKSEQDTDKKTDSLEEMMRKASIANQKAQQGTTSNVKALGRERGEFRKTKEGTTFVVEVLGDGEEVAGFYGVEGGTQGARSMQSVIGRLCIARPWASKFIAWLITPRLFDGLCASYGYRVGAGSEGVAPYVAVDTTALARDVAVRAESARRGVGLKKRKGITCTPAIVREGNPSTLEWSCDRSRVVKTGGFKTTSGATRTSVTPRENVTYGITCDDGFSDVCSVRVIRPRVAIWTEPKEVRLGARVIVYWNTEDVVSDSCIIRGPSFLERGPYGGAATVAINDTGAYTIECLAADGATSTAHTTLDLAL